MKIEMKTKKNNIGFGLFWIIFASCLIFAFYMVQSEYSGAEGIIQFLLNNSVFCIFLLVGFIMFVIGLYQAIKDSIVDKYGEECYGRVTCIRETAVEINSEKILKGEILVYIPSLNKTKVIIEEIGTDRKHYDLDDILKVKYHNNDIILLESVDKNVLSVVEESALYPKTILDSNR